MAETGSGDDAGEAPADARAASLVGRVVSDRYRIDELVAMGGMGAVYRGLHLHMRKEIAIKILHPETEDFPELVARFEREAVAGAHVSHPNVAAATDLGRFDGGSYFLVLEFVAGCTLRHLIDGGPVPWRRAAAIAEQLTLGLGAAHDHGIVHRDVKPRNVMIASQGDADVVKLIDFGFARVPLGQFPSATPDAAPPVALSEAGVVFGTAGYMAPEAALGMGAVDARADLYAVGVLLFEMLTGKHPWDEEDAPKLFALHRSAAPPSIAERNPDVEVPADLVGIVEQLLAKDPADRFQDAPSLAAALAATRRDASASVAPPESRAGAQDPPSEPPARSRGAGRLLGLALAAAAVGAGIWWVVTGGAPASGASSPIATASAKPTAPRASPTAAPSASVSVDKRYAARARADLLRAAGRANPLGNPSPRDFEDAASALVALADVDPTAFRDADVRRAAVKTAGVVVAVDSPSVDRVYFVLAYKLGSDGLDLLYDVYAEGKGESRAARRAFAILQLQAPSERSSRALRVTWELRGASCAQKGYLLQRIAAEGDARTKALLEELRAPDCDKTRCCYKRNLALERAIEAIDARAKK